MCSYRSTSIRENHGFTFTTFTDGASKDEREGERSSEVPVDAEEMEVVAAKVPITIARWLREKAREVGISKSALIRKILEACMRGDQIKVQHLASTIVVNIVEAKAEAKASSKVNLRKLVLLEELQDLLRYIKSLGSSYFNREDSYARQVKQELRQRLRELMWNLGEVDDPELLEEIKAAKRILEGGGEP